MNVSQLARRAGTTADTVRHYTELGLLRPDCVPDDGMVCGLIQSWEEEDSGTFRPLLRETRV